MCDVLSWSLRAVVVVFVLVFVLVRVLVLAIFIVLVKLGREGKLWYK